MHMPSGLFGVHVLARSLWWAMDGAITRTKYMNWSRTTCRRHGTPGPPSASPTEPRHSRSRLGLFGWPGVCLRASLEKCEVDWNQVGRKRGFFWWVCRPSNRPIPQYHLEVDASDGLTEKCEWHRYRPAGLYRYCSRPCERSSSPEVIFSPSPIGAPKCTHTCVVPTSARCGPLGPPGRVGNGLMATPCNVYSLYSLLSTVPTYPSMTLNCSSSALPCWRGTPALGSG